MLDRSAYQPTQRLAVTTGRMIYPPYIWVDAPTCDVTWGHSNRFLKPLGMANHAHTWWCNMCPLKMIFKYCVGKKLEGKRRPLR